MAVMPILRYPNPELKLRSDDVEIEWVVSDEFQELLRDMTETMLDAGGLGLSAIQVGIQDRAFVMRVAANSSPSTTIKDGVQAFVNPVIESVDGDLVAMREGCLSLPGVIEDVMRFQGVTVSALDWMSGERRTWDLWGIEAQCAQHEIDHLDGKMFSDGYGATKRDIAKRKIKKALREASR